MVKPFSLKWKIAEESAAKLIRDFLKEQSISKAALTDIKFRGGKILLNGVDVTVRERLSTGDTLEVIFPYEVPSHGLKAENIPLEIIYEDEYVLIVNKPPFMSTIPSRKHPDGSLANALLYYFQQNDIQNTIHIVTRLDRDTSGLVLIAKHRHIHHLFSNQQKEQLISRRYIAYVHGIVTKEEGIIDAPIGRKESSIIERAVRHDGQRAVTHFNVETVNHDISIVTLKLETGRTHQIRVHMSFIGHPLLGDTLYGGNKQQINRQALHCFELKFWHPILHKTLKFTSPIPDDMKNILS